MSADIFLATFRKALIGVCMCSIHVDLENLNELERIAHVHIYFIWTGILEVFLAGVERPSQRIGG